MDKYIIDGVEYSYGEEVEMSDDGDYWKKRIFISYIKNSNYPIMCVAYYDDEKFKNGENFDINYYKHIRKIQPTLSGRKAKLILEDGTEYSVTVE